MAEKVLLAEGLRIGKTELTQMQAAAQLNLKNAMGFAVNVPSVLTTVSTSGVLGGDLKVVAGSANNKVKVQAGAGLSADMSYLSLLALSADLTIASDSATYKIVATNTPSTAEPGSVSVTTGSGAVVGSGTVFTTLFTPGDAIRIGTSFNGNAGTYTIQAVADDTHLTLTANVAGTTESALTYTRAGKFFPGYPLSGTTDFVSHDSVTFSVQVNAYSLAATEILLATVVNTGSGPTAITDLRVATTPRILGLQLTDANVSTTAAIAEAKIALSAGTIAAKALAHAQNTDTYTTSPTFLVGGSAGPRVLTISDLPRLVSPSGGSTMPTVLPTEVNFVTTFLNASASDQLPQLKATWGIHGTGSFSGGVVTVTAHDNSISALTSNSLANFILVDSVGQLYKITANSSVTTNSGTSFTVSVTVDSGASQPNPTNGLVTIRVYAAAYSVRITPVEDDNVTYLPGNRKVFTADVEAGLLLTSLVTGTSIAGKTHKIELVASNAVLSPTSTIATVFKAWGSAASGTVVNVPSSSITVSSTSNVVQFSWPAPSGFDPASMDYRASHTIDGTTPSSFVDVPNEDVSGGGVINYPVNPGVLTKFAVNVIDMSGNAVSNAPGTASGFSLQATPNTNAISVDADFSALASVNFVDNGDGTLTKILRTRTNVKSMQIVGVALSITAISGTLPVVKARVWQTGTPANGVSGDPETTTVNKAYDVRSRSLGNQLTIALEKVSGTIVSITGTVTLYYLEVSNAQ